MRKLLALIFFCSNAYAVNLNGTISRDPASEASGIERAISTLNNSKAPPRSISEEKFEGKKYKSIKLKGGLLLDPSCALEASRKGLNPGDLEEKMNLFMGKMMDKVVRCMEQYPEMKSYLQQAVEQYRSQDVRCDAPQGIKGLVNPDRFNYDASHNWKGIRLSNALLTRVVGNDKAGQDTALSTIFHELLHGTKCNNRHDHNDIERIGVTSGDDNVDCKNNVTMDRVSVVESLCMGEKLGYAKETASLVLAKRMNKCGTDRGCRDMFTSKGNNIDLILGLTGISPNKDLDDSAATALCQRIKDDGMCLHYRNTQGKTITSTNPKVIAIRERLRLRLLKIGPNSNQIQTEYLSLYPDLEKRFDKLKNNTCFKRHFYISPAHPNEINALRTEAKTIVTGISSHIKRLKNDLSKFTSSLPPDSCSNDENEMISVLTDLSENLPSNPVFNKLRDAVSQDENLHYPDSKSPFHNPDLANLLGKDLTADYLKTMDQFHHESPNYDCVAAGFAPFRVMEAANQKPNACE
ncbi:MAG TPA: hypothetical protein VNJ08_05240 [Bacteriovoracaceae bacterium]|nr:hypothetical protein [Bacteriovoracaceae bacterium]